MTVYLCLTACIFLFFGLVGVLLSSNVAFTFLWGMLLLAGVLTLAAAVYFRPGVHTRTTERK